MAQFPGFAPAGTRDSSDNADVGMADVEDDESSATIPSTNESLNSSVSRTADHFGTALRISPPKLAIPNPLRNYFAVSSIVDRNFSAPPSLSTEDDMTISSSSSSGATSAPAGPPQVLPMTPVYFPPKPASAPANNYQLNSSTSSSSFAAPPPAPVKQVDTPRPKPPARNKVPLEKGYSQMVWLRLMQSEPDLAGLKGESPRRLLTMEEIKKHQSEGEAWTVLRGRVYNVTPYLKFHPGEPLQGFGEHEPSDLAHSLGPALPLGVPRTFAGLGEHEPSDLAHSQPQDYEALLQSHEEAPFIFKFDERELRWPEMLMKAAGKDGTALFNKYHAWVNAEFLLEKCMVGLLDVQGQGDK